MLSVEDKFKEELRKIIEPFKKHRAKFLGNLLFKAQTEMGIPIDTACDIIFKEEKNNRVLLIKQIEEAFYERQKSQKVA